MKIFKLLFILSFISGPLPGQVSLSTLQKIMKAKPAAVKKMLPGFNKITVESSGNITWEKSTTKEHEVVSRVCSIDNEPTVTYQFGNPVHFNKLFTAIKKETKGKAAYSFSDEYEQEMIYENAVYTYRITIKGKKEKPYLYLINIFFYKPHEPYGKNNLDEIKVEEN